ncbi:MAG: hypothetical protein K2Q20_01205, partial [Phycisphaerales bacterium]|nr:hypothetical protein [Phycisphaerales bacterium]
MGLKRIAAWVLGCLCLAGAASADTRVEVLCRVDFNDFRFGFCSGPQPCPWVDARPGQNLLVSFVVADDAFTATTFPCPNPAFVPQTTGYLIRNGTLNVRVGNVPLQGLVFPDPNPLLSQPALRLDYQNCAVDVLSLTGGTLMTRAGKCCYSNGACTYVPQDSCAGSWTQTGACMPSNTCPQPVG